MKIWLGSIALAWRNSLSVPADLNRTLPNVFARSKAIAVTAFLPLGPDAEFAADAEAQTGAENWRRSSPDCQLEQSRRGRSTPRFDHARPPSHREEAKSP